MLGALVITTTIQSIFALDVASCARLVHIATLLWLAMYLISGLAKLLSRSWVEGDALATIFLATDFGGRALGSLMLRYRLMTKAIQRGLILFEIAAPGLFLFAPAAFPYVALGVAALLHAGALVFMRLTGFAAAFFAYTPLVTFTIKETP